MYLVLPLGGFLINSFLAVLAFRSVRRHPGGRAFALALLTMGLWGYAVYMVRSSATSQAAVIWERWSFTFLAIAVALYFHFTLLLVCSRRSRRVGALLYGSLVAVLLLVHLGPVLDGAVRRFYGYAPDMGTLFALYAGFVYLMLVLSLVRLRHLYWESDSGKERNRLGHLMAGSFILLVGSATDPLAARGLPVYPLGIVSGILFGVLTTTALVNPRLLDVYLTLRRAIGYLALFGAIAGTYIVAVFVWAPGLGTARPAVMPVTAGLVIALGFSLLVFAAHHRRLFLRERWQPFVELQRFSRETRDIRDLNQLAATFVALVTRVMKAERALILVPHPQEDVLVAGHSIGIAAPRGTQLQRISPLVTWLARQDRPVSMRDLVVLPQWQGLPRAECAMLERTGSELVVPLQSKGMLVSLLFLGPRVNGRPYSPGDVDMLQTEAHQVAIAMENARLYEQLRLLVQELELAQTQLVRSAKLVATGELAASVAHEVNNPLQSILNIAYLLSMELRESPLQADVELIEREVQRARGIVGGLLDFARRGDAAWGWGDVNKMLESVLVLAQMRIRGGEVRVVMQMDPDVPPVWADGEQLKQVFLNLVTNAIDAMPGGGVLTVVSSSGWRDGRRSAFVEVRDTGLGISPDHVQRIFEPFFTTKPPGKGTGLGLSVSQSIVERHGGSIQVDSVPGQGSTFTVVLPIPIKAKEKVGVYE